MAPPEMTQRRSGAVARLLWSHIRHTLGSSHQTVCLTARAVVTSIVLYVRPTLELSCEAPFCPGFVSCNASLCSPLQGFSSRLLQSSNISIPRTTPWAQCTWNLETETSGRG